MMIDALNSARDLLNTALEGYISACSAIQSHCIWGEISDGSDCLEELIDCATRELSKFRSYEKKLRQAKAAIRVARNCSHSLVPINSLPSEILSHIFHLVLQARPCSGEQLVRSRLGQEPEFPQYPDLLSHICYRWRQIAIGSSTLWSHIDLVPPHTHRFRRRLLMRAHAYADRAGGSVLDIHMIEQGDSNSDPDIFQFLDSITTRIRSLECIISNWRPRFCSAIIGRCFVNCTPGTFTRLSIKQHGFRNTFLESTDSARATSVRGSEQMLLDIPTETLENLWDPITVLQLSGMYLCWTSKAYRGLVELRLFPWPQPNTAITESQLITILRSSPRLRVLWFNLDITDPIPSDGPISPVNLDDLEVLNVCSMEHDQLGVFLRWFALGSKPLQLSLRLPSISQRSTSPPANEVKSFFRRSKVTELHLNGFETHLAQVQEFLYLSPHVKILALDILCSGIEFSSVFRPNASHLQVTPLQLEHLYLTDCSFDVESLPVLVQMLKAHPARALTVWKCKYYRDNHSPPDNQVLRTVLLDTHPSVKFLDMDMPNPTEGLLF